MTARERRTECKYTAKPEWAICANCAHFTAVKRLPEYKTRVNIRLKKIVYTIEEHGVDTDPRCDLHKFPVIKSATCTNWQKPANK